MKTIPTPFVMSGSAQFVITIDRNAHVEVGGARGSAGNASKPETPASAEPAPELSKPKPKSPAPAPGATPDAVPDGTPDAGGERQEETE